MRTVIGLAGVKTSGKSTVTEMIQEILPGTTESALAGKLKDVCAARFNISRIAFDDQRYKEVPFSLFGLDIRLYPIAIAHILSEFNVEYTEDIGEKYKESRIIGMELKSARHIAQIVGTEVLRATGDEDIHCKNMPLNPNPELPTIVSDIRFPNEFTYFDNNPEINFIPLYLNRKEAEKHVTPDSHPSETSVFLFKDKCIGIDNNKTLEYTREQVLNALKKKGVL